MLNIEVLARHRVTPEIQTLGFTAEEAGRFYDAMGEKFLPLMRIAGEGKDFLFNSRFTRGLIYIMVRTLLVGGGTACHCGTDHPLESRDTDQMRIDLQERWRMAVGPMQKYLHDTRPEGLCRSITANAVMIATDVMQLDPVCCGSCASTLRHLSVIRRIGASAILLAFNGYHDAADELTAAFANQKASLS